MKRQSVISSMIRSVGYDKKAEVLEIEFTSGTVYQYLDVKADVHKKLMQAGSKGTYFADSVRGAYPFARVR